MNALVKDFYFILSILNLLKKSGKLSLRLCLDDLLTILLYLKIRL